MADVPSQARTRFSVLVVYAAVAIVITMVWTGRAKTEMGGNRLSSIVHIANGEASLPFVRRRLPVEVASLVVQCMPNRVWGPLANEKSHSRLVKGVLDYLNWREKDVPLLVVTTVVIGVSVFAFMVVMRYLIVCLYAVPEVYADFVGAVFGGALLGGSGGAQSTFALYPYDYPNVALFAMCFAAIVLNRLVVLLVVFPFAAYSKETSILLIPAVWIVWSQHIGMLCACRRWKASVMVYMIIVYAVAQGSLFWRFRDGFVAYEFFFPGRNSAYLAKWFVFDSWVLPFAVVCAWKWTCLWREFPRQLRCCTPLLAAMLALCFFKGFIEERRAFLEMLPIFGPLVLQWSATELGFGDLMRCRDLGLNEVPVNDV